jgi:hypothetical protein
MKRFLSFMAMVMFAANMISGASLTMVQPNGGDLCLGQENYPIRWTAVGVTEKIKLVLFRNDVRVASIAENLDPSGSPFLWKVGQHSGGTAPAGGGYKIRIRTMSGGTGDFSDAPFALKTGSPPCLPPPPAPVLLRLESPNGDEKYTLHHEYTISWKSTAPASVGKVQLQLHRHPCCFVGVIRENLPPTGSFTWKAGEYSGNTAPAGKYEIRVCSMSDDKIFDMSDAPFDLISFVGKIDRPLAEKLAGNSVTKKAMITNWLGSTTFPSKISPPMPLSVVEARPVCEHGTNDLALVGAEWFQYASNVRAARLQRSKLVFPLHDLLGEGMNLKQATLKLKRISCVCNGGPRVASCVFNIEVLQAPWTNYFSTPGHWIGGPSGSGDIFSKDVTETVRKWLDGSEDYKYGFLLIGDEAPTSKDFACFSCFEPSLVLTMK